MASVSVQLLLIFFKEICVSIFICVFDHTPSGMQGLSSLNRERSQTPVLGHAVLITGPPGRFLPYLQFLVSICFLTLGQHM